MGHHNVVHSTLLVKIRLFLKIFDKLKESSLLFRTVNDKEGFFKHGQIVIKNFEERHFIKICLVLKPLQRNSSGHIYYTSCSCNLSMGRISQSFCPA
jgi:hypothetical protein